MELSFQTAHTLQLWWKAACFAASKLDLGRLTLSLETEGGESMLMHIWQNNGLDNGSESSVSMTVPVWDYPDGRQYRLQVELQGGPSIEPAGRRLTLFARLIDKYGLIEYTDYESAMVRELISHKNKYNDEEE